MTAVAGSIHLHPESYAWLGEVGFILFGETASKEPCPNS